MTGPQEEQVPTATGSSRPLTTARFAQMTHASYDRRDGVTRGGWQVKHVTPGVTELERARLRAAVSTSVTSARPMSAFPGLDEIEALPRRLVLSVEDDGSGIYSHSAPAGDDATGRPGNVFAHVLLDRLLTDVLQDSVADRPVQMWRSPGWLTPFGPRDVLAAEADDARPPACDGPMDRRAAVEFLLDPARYRFATLALLLDAVAQALDGGPAVVVVADSLDEGALWLAAVSFFAAPVACARLTFSTYARSRELLDQRVLPLVSVVLREDAEDPLLQKEARLLLVDPLDEPETETVDGVEVRRTQYGSIVPTSPWSALVLDLCSTDVEQVLECLQAMDTLAPVAGLRPQDCAWWALAAAVAQAPELELSWPTAATVVLSSTPDEVPLDGDLGASLVRLLRTCTGRSADEAWSLLSGPRGQKGQRALVDLVREVYLERALTDPGWLTAPATPPVLGRVHRVERARLCAAAERGVGLLRAALPERDDQAVAALRLLDLAVRSDVTPPPLPGGPLSELVGWVVRMLCHRGRGAEIVRRCGAVAADTVRYVLAPELRLALPDLRRAPGDRLDPAVTEWLTEGYGPLPAGRLDPLEEELAIVRCRRGPEEALRARAAIALLDSAFWEPSEEPVVRADAALAAVGGDQPWGCGDLRVVVHEVGNLPDVDLVPAVVEVLRMQVPDETTQELAAATLAAQRRRPEALLDGWQRRVLLTYGELDPGWVAGDDPLHAIRVVTNGLPLWESGVLGPAAGDAVAGHVLAAALMLAVFSAARLAVLSLSQVEWLDRLRGLDGLVERGMADAVVLLRPMVDREDFRGWLTDVAVRRRIVGEEGPVPRGAVELLLRQGPTEDPSFGGTLAELLLADLWTSHDRATVLQERDRVVAKYVLSKGRRSALHAWWEQFLPSGKRARWRR